mmetsp:Transcript_21442/g.43659  ORF Transcript_21442/g.43659 Transcript_21442/m.43659 type:complete len:136 (+) Transcript_21442:56-463(+)
MVSSLPVLSRTSSSFLSRNKNTELSSEKKTPFGAVHQVSPTLPTLSRTSSSFLSGNGLTHQRHEVKTAFDEDEFRRPGSLSAKAYDDRRLSVSSDESEGKLFGMAEGLRNIANHSYRSCLCSKKLNLWLVNNIID